MSENKDQKPADAPEGNDPEALSVDEIDKVIAEEDPKFLEQVNDIKITGQATELSVMNEAFHLLAESEIKWTDRLKELVNIKKNPKKVLSFWGTFVAIGILFFVTWGLKKTFLEQKLFMTSYLDLGGVVHDYNPLTETDFFYDNPKFSKNIMTMSKMFINIKPSENSGPNPMLAIEMNVEGLSADAIIEIKDREAEFKDLLLRISEEKTYDELVVTKGKQELCEQFRQAINAHLTRGQVRKVLLNSFIIKP